MTKLFLLAMAVMLFIMLSLFTDVFGQTKMKISFRSFDENSHTFDIQRAWFNPPKDTLHLLIDGEEAYALSVNGSYWATGNPVYFKGKEHTGYIRVQFKQIILMNPLFNQVERE